ncbi:hypothetical protein CEXT_236411 [Caerostris extrusa]|uniref:Uncharacterized protein n=1 Tax=Caerostris extrusa TaxID=172846 RepID=A0AAV4RZI4_CAEEX|nr:hypothetical protein CEXT_236411 [Caerostris extrusa]
MWRAAVRGKLPSPFPRATCRPATATGSTCCNFIPPPATPLSSGLISLIFINAGPLERRVCDARVPWIKMNEMILGVAVVDVSQNYQFVCVIFLLSGGVEAKNLVGGNEREKIGGRVKAAPGAEASDRGCRWKEIANHLSAPIPCGKKRIKVTYSQRNVVKTVDI